MEVLSLPGEGKRDRVGPEPGGGPEGQETRANIAGTHTQ